MIDFLQRIEPIKKIEFSFHFLKRKGRIILYYLVTKYIDNKKKNIQNNIAAVIL